MVSQIRHWMAYRELIALARRSDLSSIEPEAIIKLLYVFARSAAQRGDSSSLSFLNLFTRRDSEGREAILRIWEMARSCYLADTFKRAKWHLVMASCTSLYEKLGQAEKARNVDVPQLRRAA
jgi:hypothetical protein